MNFLTNLIFVLNLLKTLINLNIFYQEQPDAVFSLRLLLFFT